MRKMRLRPGSAPEPAGAVHNAPPDPVAGVDMKVGNMEGGIERAGEGKGTESNGTEREKGGNGN